MKKKGKAVVLIAVLLVGLTIGTGIAMDLPNKVTKEVVIESEDGQTRMTWVAMTSLGGTDRVIAPSLQILFTRSVSKRTSIAVERR